MPLPEIRPMRPEDVDAAAELTLSNGWGVRREWLRFATEHASCSPFVAVDDGAILGTGIGTVSGTVGWVGTIFVAPERRGQGLGEALTQATIDALERAGCRTLVLVATKQGRPLYERMGFELQTAYRILEASGLAKTAVASPLAAHRVRAFEPGDLQSMVALDRRATGEDRAHALARLADATTSKVVAGADGVTGFVVRPPWGGGATVAATLADALAIVEARRLSSGPEGRVRVGVLEENVAGLAALASAGFRQEWSAPRLLRGVPMDWHPERIWGQFNHAMG